MTLENPVDRARCPRGLSLLVRVERRGPWRCWTWIGRVDAGYPRIGRAERAHRIVYLILRGPLGRNVELDHLCRNPSCVRPDHLEPVDHAENMRRLRQRKCQRGHRLEGANVTPSGKKKANGERGRTCRRCLLARKQKYREAKREAP